MRLMDSQSGDDQQHPSPEQGQGESAIVWTASEYLEHQKSGGWYLRGWMAIIFIALLAYVFLVGKSGGYRDSLDALPLRKSNL